MKLIIYGRGSMEIPAVGALSLFFLEKKRLQSIKWTASSLIQVNIVNDITIWNIMYVMTYNKKYKLLVYNKDFSKSLLYSKDNNMF